MDPKTSPHETVIFTGFRNFIGMVSRFIKSGDHDMEQKCPPKCEQYDFDIDRIMVNAILKPFLYH